MNIYQKLVLVVCFAAIGFLCIMGVYKEGYLAGIGENPSYVMEPVQPSSTWEFYTPSQPKNRWQPVIDILSQAKEVNISINGTDKGGGIHIHLVFDAESK